MKFLIVLKILLIFSLTSCGQEKYVLTKERIEPKPQNLVSIQKDRFYYPAGTNGDLLIFQFNRKQTTSLNSFSLQAASLVLYDEKKKEIVDSVKVDVQTKKAYKVYQYKDLKLFQGVFNVPPDLLEKTLDDLSGGDTFLEHQDIWLQFPEGELRLISFNEHFLDKDVYYSIDNSGRYIVVNTFVSTYLRSSKADSIITIFDVSNRDQIKRTEFYCSECIKPQIIDNYLYYGKKFYYLKGGDVYDWKLCRAPIFDLSKSELLAEYIEPILISPDGKYAVGRKTLYGKPTLVMIDITHKKYQYLLGRAYATSRLFYSISLYQFAIDRENDIIYIENPKNFQYNSVGEDAKSKRTSVADDNLFWNQLKQHPN